MSDFRTSTIRRPAMIIENYRKPVRLEMRTLDSRCRSLERAILPGPDAVREAGSAHISEIDCEIGENSARTCAL